MATFLLNSTSGEVIAARITPRAGANPFAIDGCGRNCSFMYEAPELKKASELNFGRPSYSFDDELRMR